MTSSNVSRKIGVGLLGYGASGATFHVPLIAAEPRLRLVAISSLAPEAVRHALPGVTATDQPNDVINHPDVELVVVATPNASHAELAQAALLGRKHVVVDKPFTVRTQDADALIDLATAQSRLISVFHNRRWDGDFQTVRACITSGALGEIRSYAARFDRYVPNIRAGWREQPSEGSGVLYDLGSHLIDQALVLFGLPREVWATVVTQRDGGLVPDAFHLVLLYDRLQVVLEARSLVRDPGPRYEVHGTDGSFVKYGLDSQEAALKAGRLPGEPGWGIDPSDGRLTYGLADLHVSATVATIPGAYQTFYAQIASAIMDGSPPPVEAGSARDVVRVIELALESARTGRIVDAGWSS